MPIYKKEPDGIREVVDKLVEQFHGGLCDANVKIDILGAWAATDQNGDTEAVALKLHGYPCQATMAVVSYKNRVLGGGDALLTVDIENWEELSTEEREALIDHELEHLELRTDKDGLIIRDDLDRPKMHIRRHDHQFGWFDSVARRHGPASIEIKQLREFNAAHEQLWLPFESDDEAQAAARNNRKFKEPGAAAEADEAEGSLPEGYSVGIKAGDGPEVKLTAKQFNKLGKAIKAATKGKRGGQRKLAGV